MGTLSTIVIIALLSLPVVASFILMHRGRVSLALAVFGMGFLAGHQVLQHVAYADLYRYNSVADADGKDFLGRTVSEPTWGYLPDTAFNALAGIGFGLIALAAIVFGINRIVRWHKQRVQVAELSSQAAQREHEKKLQERGWPVGTKADTDLPSYSDPAAGRS